MKHHGDCEGFPTMYRWTLEMPEIWDTHVGKIRKLEDTFSIRDNLRVSNYWYFDDLNKSEIVSITIKDIFTFNGTCNSKMDTIPDALYHLEMKIKEINQEIEIDKKWEGRGGEAKKEGLSLLLDAMTNAYKLVQKTYLPSTDLPKMVGVYSPELKERHLWRTKNPTSYPEFIIPDNLKIWN